MWRQRNVCLLACLLCLVASSRSITVTERTSTEPGIRNTTASVYRVSAPKTKQPSNRVPAHLQGIRSVGYAYDDADDVIHIIEPPQHFQQLKRLMQQHQQQQQQDEVAVWTQQRKVRITRPSMVIKMPMKVKESLQQRATTKVDRPAVHRHQQQRPKPAADMLPQETHAQRLHQVHVPPPPLPLEILVSVRKTERLLQQQQQQQSGKQPPSKWPFPKQRLKTQKTHTVIMEKAYEEEKFARDQEQRLSGQKWRKTRARRNVKNISADASAVDEALRGARQDIEKGTKLLMRLKALLKSADTYLPADDCAANYTSTRLAANGTEAKAANATAELQKILESSLNATSVIMQQVQRTRSATGAKRRASIRDERLEGKPSSRTSFASAATVKRVKKQGATPDDWADYTNQPSQPDRVTTATVLYDDVMTNIRRMLEAHNAELLAEHQPSAGFDGNDTESTSSSSFLDASASAPIAVEQWGELQQLQLYLQELHQLVTQLPAVGAGPNNTDLALNTHEFIAGDGSGARNRSAADWYLINGDGQIFETRLHEKLKPTTSIFHRFPDIPVTGGRQQLSNGTLESLDTL